MAAAVLLGATMGGPAALAAIAGVASGAIPSSTTPSVGQPIVVSIHIDMSGADAPNDALGSFSGTLDWDPAVLSYVSQSGILAGFTGVVNTAEAANGHIDFNGVHMAGAMGNITVLTITLGATGAGTSALDPGYSAMAAAATFANLLPVLTITDDQVVVSSANQFELYLPWIAGL